MRWDVLIQDLSDRFEYLSRQDGTDMVPELVRAERAGIALYQRLLGSLACEITVSCQGGVAVAGRLEHVGADWILLVEGDSSAQRCSIVRVAKIRSIQGLIDKVVQSDSEGSRRLSFAAVLRQMGQSRLPVSFVYGPSTISGYIVAVGKDWVDLRDKDRPEHIATFSLGSLEIVSNRAVRTVRP